MDKVSVPGLTTAHLFFRQCGEEAAGLLLDLLESKTQTAGVRQIRLQYLIMERGSV
jgi:LacI family sucrose operon transcriptional repressor